ncbi:acetyl-CoA acetyltransferase [Paenibacillus selenitireducens]|uniref:acetyl-CoA C-acetyltransferase n=1 Tax=Paenibacillus selenitireducens TaxID=1324314 RepID=A0A1T2XJS0_9BACL|nr:acetyl-CoA C-acetyltransferase [Paenibacillus selenitireducens]OPA80104.1 acetyl-CoA acetyltransferase [Paenibacillus selenitireducens]
MGEAVITSAVRTPIGSMMGVYQQVSAVELGALTLREAMARSQIESGQVEQIWMGNVLQAGAGQNPARQAGFMAAVPVHVPAATLNFVCGSGLMAVMLGAQSIRADESSIVLAGGMENMSQAPYVLKQARGGYRIGDGQLIDSIMHDGLRCAIADVPMGVTAERLAERFAIGRDEQDAFALSSQVKAAQAVAEQCFAEELVTVRYTDRKGSTVTVEQDEHPRAGMTLQILGKLKPSFEQGGTVTPGNASGINDGAAAIVLSSEQRARELHLQPIARIRGYAHVGIEPEWMGLGPVPAIRKALQRAGLRMQDVDLFELNEAFAVQTLAVMRELDIDPAKINVHGGAIALGHPIGASGTRILVTLLHAMKQRNVRTGVAALCVGGGHGIAIVVEAMA